MSFIAGSSKHSILITGGGSGIGLGFAKNFIATGHEVIICGRRQDVLENAKAQCPGLKSITCDGAQYYLILIQR